jgi:hypothetical protein
MKESGCELRISLFRSTIDCKSILVFAYLFTRVQFPEPSVVQEMVDVLVGCGVSPGDVMYHDQTNCTIC